jgi:phenylalanyl-tRNA synthetase alpha chain
VLNKAGQDAGTKGMSLETDEVSQLTPEHMQSGKWRTVKMRKYHVESFAPALHGGRKHPIRELMNEVRSIFIEMGFTEIEYDYVQPCFWNMDALFIPQDHPARDIQDTFYLKKPAKLPITDKPLIEKIRAMHENGGGTGSSGWNYIWNLDEAERTVLRTHTTVNTIRYLSDHAQPPVKVFSIGRIFRNEATDATHLTELHQIEGIVMEKGASLATLVGTLREFYRRIGFPDVMVTTSYYPYTEPSLDVAVKFRGRILELGGCGIFRPEVTAPFGVKHNVLAWGLGLERLALIKWGMKDIRETISNDLEFLRNRKIVK